MENKNKVIFALNKNNKTSLHKIIQLKEYIVVNQSIPITYSPIAYFWVIRHFLGLLPLPLLPKYSEKTVLDWKGIAERCQLIIKSSDFTDLYSLDAEILNLIRLIPYSNYLFLQLLLNFMRIICERNDKTLCKKSVCALAKYFSSSIFLRPFQPGFKTKESKPYDYLLFYLIIRWNKIKVRRVNSQYNFNWKNTGQKGTSYSHMNFDFIDNRDSRFYYYLTDKNTVHIKDSSCQTGSYNESNSQICGRIRNVQKCCCSYGSHYEQHFQSISEEIEIFDSKSSVSMDVKSDTICATDEDRKSVILEDNISTQSLQIKSESAQSVEDSQDSPAHTEPNKECHTYGWVTVNENILYSEESEQYLNKNYESSSDNCKVQYIQNSPANSIQQVNKDNNQEEPKTNQLFKIDTPKIKTSKNSEGYMYDDYDTFKKENFNQISQKVTNPFTLDIESIQEKSLKLKESSQNTDMVVKVSKIGWTYTPSSKIKNVNDEESKLRNKSDSDIPESEVTEGTINSVNEEFSNMSANSWSSLISMKKFKVNMDFLKKIKSKKFVLSPKSSSIKYKKLESKSNTF